MSHFYFLIQEFVDACLQYGNSAEAHKYLPRVKEDLQVKYYVMAKLVENTPTILSHHN